MPVKFRCEQCGQLLGISRRKIGMAVACPKCRHAIHVPEEDQVELASQPRSARIFEQSDFHKLIAKRERAAENVASIDPIEIGDVNAVALLESEPPIVLESKEIVPALERRTKSKRIQVPIPPQIAPQIAPVASIAPATIPKPQANEARTEVTPTPASALVASAPSSMLPPVSQPRSAPVEDSRLSIELVAVFGMALAFAAGLAVGRYLLPAPPVERPVGKVDRNVKGFEAQPQQPAGLAAAKDAAAPAAAARLTGMIRVKDQGEVKPDALASIVVFPANKAAAEKIAGAAIRPGGESDNGETRKRLRMYGGDQAFADKQGKFAISIPQPGDYWVLLISAKVARERGEIVPADERATIAQFFGNVQDLIENQSYLLISRRLDASADAQLNHIFGSK